MAPNKLVHSCRGARREEKEREVEEDPERESARACDAVSDGRPHGGGGSDFGRNLPGGRAHAQPRSEPPRDPPWLSRQLTRTGEEACEPPPSGPVGVRPLVGPGKWKRWKIAISNTWKHGAHINVLELYAETLAMSWVLRKGSACTPLRFVLLQDSQVAVFSGTKGRSSSLPLLRALRRTAALLLAGNLYVDRLWIPSKANPADGPSRKRAVGVF